MYKLGSDLITVGPLGGVRREHPQGHEDAGRDGE